MCSYLFDVSEPWSSMAATGDWQAMWYLNFEQANEMHDLEINWSFLPNKIVDQTDKSSLNLPLPSGFKFSEELYFNFQTTQLYRRYALNLTAKMADLEASKSSKSDETQDSYLKIANLAHASAETTTVEKSMEELGLDLTSIFTVGKLIRLNSSNVLIKIMRNNQWSMNITYKMESVDGECDFDESICNYTGNPLFETALKSLWFEEASKNVAQLRHEPKYELLNLNHQSTDEKIKDFYLSIEHTLTGEENWSKPIRKSVFSPLLRVQTSKGTGKNSSSSSSLVGTKVFSVSFDYKTLMHENKDLDGMEMFIQPLRSDMKFGVKPKLGEIFRYYTSPSTLNGSPEPFVRVSETCESETFKSLLNSKSLAQTMRAEEPGFYWRHAHNITVFSCFDFRLGFAVNFLKGKSTQMKAGIDNVQISYSQGKHHRPSPGICHNSF